MVNLLPILFEPIEFVGKRIWLGTDQIWKPEKDGKWYIENELNIIDKKIY